MVSSKRVTFSLLNPARFLAPLSTLIPGIEPKLLINSGIDFPEEVFSYAKRNDIILQGNLKPKILIEGGRKLKEGIKKTLNKFNENKHIFNLSHGVLPQTPVENVEILVETVRRKNET